MAALSDDSSETSIVKRINHCLEQYYNCKHKSYVNDDGVSKFMHWVDENGYDTETVEQDFTMGGYDEACIVDFDDDFPINETGDERLKEIFRILNLFWKHPKECCKIMEYFNKQSLLFEGKSKQEIKQIQYDLRIAIGFTDENIWKPFYNGLLNKILDNDLKAEEGLIKAGLVAKKIKNPDYILHQLEILQASDPLNKDYFHILERLILKYNRILNQ